MTACTSLSEAALGHHAHCQLTAPAPAPREEGDLFRFFAFLTFSSPLPSAEAAAPSSAFLSFFFFFLVSAADRFDVLAQQLFLELLLEAPNFITGLQQLGFQTFAA